MNSPHSRWEYRSKFPIICDLTRKETGVLLFNGTCFNPDRGRWSYETDWWSEEASSQIK